MNINRLFVLLFSLWSIQDVCLGSYNTSHWSSYRRTKRTIIFQNSGVAKFVFGLITPVETADQKPWRQLVCTINLQAQYAVPTKPIYFWDKFGDRSLQDTREDFEKFGKYVRDQSRSFLFAALEMYMDKLGKNGRKCLQRAVCENAAVDTSEGIFSEIIHLALKPIGDENIDGDFVDAYEAGKYGGICHLLYPQCPLGDGLLDNVSIIESRKNTCSR